MKVIDINDLRAELKAQAEQHINRIWRAMVAGFQATDPTLATQWGVHKPAGFVSKEAKNPGLSMYCQNRKISILVEYNAETALYLLSYKKDGQDGIEPLATVLAPEAIAPTIIEFLAAPSHPSPKGEG